MNTQIRFVNYLCTRNSKLTSELTKKRRRAVVGRRDADSASRKPKALYLSALEGDMRPSASKLTMTSRKGNSRTGVVCRQLNVLYMLCLPYYFQCPVSLAALWVGAMVSDLTYNSRGRREPLALMILKLVGFDPLRFESQAGQAQKSPWRLVLHRLFSLVLPRLAG